MREARRPRGGGGICWEVEEGVGRREMWCQVRE